jgi:hypothetical protein
MVDNLGFFFSALFDTFSSEPVNQSQKDSDMSRRATQSQRFPRWTKFAFTLALILSCRLPAGAAFSNGWLETFNGVNIDTGTWRQVNPELISQNNSAFFAVANSPGIVSELITTDVRLGIGGRAQVQVAISALTSTPNYAKFAYLALTTDSSGFGTPWDSYGLNTELSSAGALSGLVASTPLSVTNIAPLRIFPVSLNTTYSLLLERLSDTQVRYTVMDGQGLNILGQVTRILPSYTEPLYVALGARSVDATFDNLQLFGTVVPEPTTFSLLSFCSLALLVGRRRK